MFLLLFSFDCITEYFTNIMIFNTILRLETQGAYWNDFTTLYRLGQAGWEMGNSSRRPHGVSWRRWLQDAGLDKPRRPHRGKGSGEELYIFSLYHMTEYFTILMIFISDIFRSSCLVGLRDLCLGTARRLISPRCMCITHTWTPRWMSSIPPTASGGSTSKWANEGRLAAERIGEL